MPRSRSFALAILGYVVPTFILGYTWHFWLFPGVYEALGIYNRPDPIIPLGFLSMLIQGVIMAYLYPFFYRGDRPVARGVGFGLLMGAFLFSVSTLANAAKMMVTSIGTWLLIQIAFHIIQFVIAGAFIGLAYGKDLAPVRDARVLS